MTPRTVRTLLRVDGLAELALGVLVYARLGFSWGLFAALILAPDIFMLGYLAGPATGSRVYNAGHSRILPLVFATAGLGLDSRFLLALGIVWFCHIAMDHAAGYGYKYADSFKHTHLQDL